MFEWNEPFQLVMKIKDDYKNEYGLDTLDFNTWLEKLNKQEYNNVFDCLQINQNHEFLLIRYDIADMQESMWTNENSIYRECRSVVIDLDKEQLVLTPFRKFFNLNEVSENNINIIIEKIKNAKTVEFTDKLDGSMQSVRYYNDDYFMAGSMALDSEKSWRLQHGYGMLTDNHKRMIKENPQYTFIFEYISLKDAHVVLYKKEQEGLYLIGMRNVFTGEELSYKELRGYSKRYDVAMVKIENVTLDQVLKDMKKYKSSEKEGWVLNIEGHKIKIKCDDYVHLHRLLDRVSSINVIIQNIADDKYDDMISKIPDIYKDRVHQIANKIFTYKKNVEEQINEYFSKAPKSNTKEFMIWIDGNCPKEISGYVKSKYLNKSFNVLKKGLNGYKKLKDLGISDSYSALFTDLEG